MNPDLGNLVNFIKLTHEIRNVRRAIIFENDLVRENDMEHMYQLALIAWFIIEKDKLKLNKEKVIGMAMVHDIVEVYTGDIPTYAAEHSSPAKAINERLAAARLKKEWPQFKSLHQLIHEYEERESPEAKFVYALDKILPMVNNYLYGGRTWRKNNLSLKWLKQSKVGKADISPEALGYYNDVVKLLENNPKLFGKIK